MSDKNADSYELFRYQPDAGNEKLDRIGYGPEPSLNRRLTVACEDFNDIFSMTLPREPADLPPFSVKINKEEWETNMNRRPPRNQSTLKNLAVEKLLTTCKKLVS